MSLTEESSSLLHMAFWSLQELIMPRKSPFTIVLSALVGIG